MQVNPMQWFIRSLVPSMLILIMVIGGCDSTSVAAPELNPPILLRPIDAQSVIVDNPVSFSWGAVDGAARYQCEVRYSDDEDAGVITEFTDKTSASLTFTQPGVYAWRVRARNGNDDAGYWSEMWEIVVQGKGDDAVDL